MIEYHKNCKNIIKNKIYFRAASFCSCARFRCSSFSCSISFCLCICFSISACLRLSCSSLHNRKRGHRHFFFTRHASLISCHATLLPYFLLLLGLLPLFALSLFLLLSLNLQQRFAPTLQFRLTFLEVLFAFVLKWSLQKGRAFFLSSCAKKRRVFLYESRAHAHTCGMPASGSIFSVAFWDVRLLWRCRLNEGGMSSSGSVVGIFSPVLAISQRCIARTNSSEPKRPSESISDRALELMYTQIFTTTSVFYNVKRNYLSRVYIPYLSEHGLRQLRLHHDISRLGPGQEAGSRSVPSVEQLGVLQLALMRHRPFYGLRRADGMLAVLRVHGAHSIYTRWPSRCAQRCVRGHGRLRDSAVHQRAVRGRRGYQRQCHGRSDSSAWK